MSFYQKFYHWLDKQGHSAWRKQLQPQIAQKLSLQIHGKMPLWQQSLNDLPFILPSVVELKQDVRVGAAKDIAGIALDDFKTLLKNFNPWRKGPFYLFDMLLDTEWHSDWKWDRVSPHIQSLRGRKVLDVGSGNGYFGWRMLGEEAEMVIGIDPTLVFVMQYQVIQRYLQSNQHYVLPIGIEQLPEALNLFDSVFSMGVLYHRRSPLEHLMELRGCLRAGGELILETLVIDGELGMTLMPEGRYAKMNNVWFIPSVPTMILWLQRCGYKQVRCANVSVTTLEEQRATEWMTFESLTDFLNPADQNLTIEGYPGPKRAVFIAEAP